MFIEPLESRNFFSAAPLGPAASHPPQLPAVQYSANNNKTPPPNDPAPQPVVISIIAILIGL